MYTDVQWDQSGFNCRTDSEEDSVVNVVRAELTTRAFSWFSPKTWHESDGFMGLKRT